jgi:hypothetical protein
LGCITKHRVWTSIICQHASFVNPPPRLTDRTPAHVYPNPQILAVTTRSRAKRALLRTPLCTPCLIPLLSCSTVFVHASLSSRAPRRAVHHSSIYLRQPRAISCTGTFRILSTVSTPPRGEPLLVSVSVDCRADRVMAWALVCASKAARAGRLSSSTSYATSSSVQTLPQ